MISSFMDELIHFLRALDAHEVSHSGRSLLTHLVGTMNIVERWGGDLNTRKAALFHSVYGTEFFKNARLSIRDRSRVAQTIGPEAERLVYVFCAMDRSSVYKAIEKGEPYAVEDRNSAAWIALSPDEFRSLVMILWANAVEQTWCADKISTRKQVALCEKFLPAAAVRELHAYASGLDTLLPSGLEHFPEQPFFCQGPVERLAGLVDFSLEQLTKMPRKYTQAFHRTPGSHTGFNISQGDEIRYYDQGHTVYWHSLHCPSMKAWVQGIERDLNIMSGGTRVSAFASKHGDGLEAHYDPNDNFVCQAKGTKRWRVATEARVRFATSGYTVGAEANQVTLAEAGHDLPRTMPEPFETVLMEPGDVMFMPRGIWHTTETLSDESLHFNMQLGMPTWKDVLDFVLSTTLHLHEEAFRAPVLGPRVVSAQVQEKIRKLVEGLGNGDLAFDQDAFRRFLAKRRGV